LIGRSFQGLSVAIETVRIIEELVEIWPNEVCDNNDKDAITAIPFPHDGRATDYFIHFAKYQNRIQWNDRSLCKVVKNTISTRISEKLHYSQENLSSFEGYKRAVMRINDNY